VPSLLEDSGILGAALGTRAESACKRQTFAEGRVKMRSTYYLSCLVFFFFLLARVQSSYAPDYAKTAAGSAVLTQQRIVGSHRAPHTKLVRIV
jgi:hypothetical protein